MHPLLVRNRDPETEVTLVQFRYPCGGVSQTKHLLDKNQYVLCGCRQGQVDPDEKLVAEVEQRRFGDVVGCETACKRCTGQSYTARNTD